MSIFGKKPSGHGIPEGDPQKPNFDAPNLDQYTYQTNTGTSSPARAPAAPSLEPPQVQKAMPPSVTQAPAMNPHATLPPNQAVRTARTVPPQAQREGSTTQPNSSYSIEDVIRLMRELPDSKKEMVVVIVQKTLLSAKIDVGAIIEDAARMVDKLGRQNDKLVSEIRELEEAIIQKKGEVDLLARELDETNSVKQIFEATYGRHVRGEGEDGKTNPPTMKLF